MITVLRALADGPSQLVVPAPGPGEGYWAGGPSAVVRDGVVWLAYRLRRPVDQGRGYANVVARSSDGLRFEPVTTVTSAQFDCASLERPALVALPAGGWRLYVSCSTPGSKHWWVEALDADDPADLANGKRNVVLPGDADTAWKDVVVHADDGLWRMWACRHPLDGGEDEADRMSTWYGTSPDGLAWTMHGPALVPTAQTWDARGTRVTSVIRADGRWWALYDGRRTAAQNWQERCGLAVGDDPARFHPVDGPVPERIGGTLRYASVVEVGAERRVYVETVNATGAHDLRCVAVRRS